MSDNKRRALEVLHNLNWLMEPHESYAELVRADDSSVVIRCVGYCAECKTDCVRIAFSERMPDVELIIQ